MPVEPKRMLGLIATALLAPALVAACSASNADPQPSGSPSASGQPTGSPSGTSVTEQTPNPSVSVAWGDGRNTPGMKEGIPNPPGWYDRAFGGPTNQKVIYVTYDDGPTQAYTGQILALLKRYDAKATFFVVGKQVSAFPRLIDQESLAGHAIGDHTQKHPDLVSLTPAKAKEELASVQRQVGARLGPCMRPPYGLIDEQAAAVSDSLGLTPILWTGQAQDWDAPPVSKIVAGMKQATRPGAVLLLHDGGGSRQNTVDSTAELLPWWKAAGYRLETVPACRPAP